MKRRRSLSSIIACGICVLIVLAWVRSYWVSDGLFWKDKRVMLRAVSSRGGLLVGYWKVMGSEDLPQVGLGYSRRLPRDFSEMQVRPEIGTGSARRWSRLGFVIERDGGTNTRGGVAIVPYWMLLVVGGLAIFGRRLVWTPIVRRRRLRRGLCQACGYDLRGSAERCPECGRATAPAAL